MKKSQFKAAQNRFLAVMGPCVLHPSMNDAIDIIPKLCLTLLHATVLYRNPKFLIFACYFRAGKKMNQ